MHPTVFISRDKNRAQAFTDIINNASSEIICESLLEFNEVTSAGLPDDGWLFFYSQTGVDYFLRQHSKDALESRKLKIASFGPKTGQHLIDHGLSVDFIGSGEARSTATTFLEDQKPLRVCFVKGTTSKDSIKPLVEESVETSSMVVYDNQSKTFLNFPQANILVFTSPLNLETYFNHYSIESTQKVVVIGTSTAMAALNMGIEEVHISNEPSLESLATLVLKLCTTWSSLK